MGLLPSWLRRQSARHPCELSRGSESHLPRLPPNAAFGARFKRRLQKVLLVSAGHPYTRIYLRSKAAIAFEKRRHGISTYWWVVHPCSKFRFLWDILMAFTYLYMFSMIPFTMSFYRLPKRTNNLSETLTWLNPGYIICLVDIMVNCITGYISQDGHEIFIDPVLIIRHYIRRFFFIDFLSSVPWIYNERLEEPGPDTKLYLFFFEILPLLKFFRLCTLRHYVKEIVVACGASRVYQQGIWILGLTILFFHLAACFTYLLPIFYAYVTKTPKENAEGFLFNTKLYEQPLWFIYLTCLHMGGSNLCSYSYTEFKDTDFPDKMTRSILLLLGMAYFLYVIVIVLQLVSSSAEPELKYQSIIHGVKDYIRNKKLPKKLKNRLLHFYEHRFQGSLFKEKAITSTLSKHLKNEITQHSSRILLESTPLFNNISRNTLNNIIGVLKQVIFLQDDVIYKCDSSGKCMYFIITGTIAMITCSGEEISHVKDGDYFGESALFEHEHKRPNTAIALEVCEVLRLDRRDFNRWVPIKSEFYKQLQLTAQKRIKELKLIDNRTLDFKDENLDDRRLSDPQIKVEDYEKTDSNDVKSNGNDNMTEFVEKDEKQDDDDDDDDDENK